MSSAIILVGNYEIQLLFLSYLFLLIKSSKFKKGVITESFIHISYPCLRCIYIFFKKYLYLIINLFYFIYLGLEISKHVF